MSLARKKILLIQPFIYDDRGGLLKKRRLQFVGLAYPLLAAMSPPDWEIELCLETIEEIPWDTDAAVVGDAKNVWLDVLSDLEAGSLKPRYHVPLRHLSTPLPRYELVTGKKIGQFLPVQAGRGCPNACSFCSIYCLYRTRYFGWPARPSPRPSSICSRPSPERTCTSATSGRAGSWTRTRSPTPPRTR